MAHKLYIFIHIYKTAGQTLLRNFEGNFLGDAWLPMYAGPMGLDKSVGRVNLGWETQRVRDYVAQAPSNTKCIFGHMAYVGVHNLVQADVEPYYITFLRDPIARCWSLYSYLKNDSPSAWHDEIVQGNWSIEEWFDKSQAMVHYNGQLRQLLIGDYEEVLTQRELTREHLEEGKRRLRQFWFVGLTETFRDDSHYLYGKLGFRRYHINPVVNATSYKEKITPRIKQMIAERNALDVELYELARELREQYVRNHAQEFDANRRKALRRSALYKAIQPLLTHPLSQPAKRAKHLLLDKRAR